MLPDARVAHRWLGQVIETDDGVPFIGEIVDRQFAATGFCGNGFTLGTIAAMMARDHFLGRENVFSEVFDVKRKVLSGALRYIRENIDYPFYLARDRLAGAEARSVREIRKGEGKIVAAKDGKVAAYRDENGKVTKVSAICTHMGCVVAWNGADKTWDCPCHGSRFRIDGEVLAGPAEEKLKPRR